MMSTEGLLDPEHVNIWRKLTITRRALQKVRSKELWKYEITSAEAMVFSSIKTMNDNDVTPGKIARWSLTDPHAVSQLLKRMEKRGLVTRTRDTRHKNRLLIAMTEKGEQTYEKSSQRITQNKLMSSLSVVQRNQLESCLDTLYDAAMNELGIDYKWLFP